MVSLAGLLLCCLAGWWAWHSQTGLPPIVTEIYERGQYRRTVTLNQFKKRAITIGSGKTDIQLDDETVPPLAARIIGQRGINGERQAVLEILDPDNPKIVVERQVLTDGDVYLVGNYEFVFTQYEAEESFFEGVETHV